METKPIKFSLRDLLAFVFFAALCIASLCVGGLLISIAAMIGVVFVMGTAIVAFVGVARPKAFAIGFLVPLIVYAAVIVLAGEHEMTLYGGRLPISRLLTNSYMGSETLIARHPDGTTFVILGNCLFAWMLALCGGKFAVFVYQLQHQTDNPDESSDAPESR